MNLSRITFGLLCLLSFTISLENFFLIFLGVNTSFELYRLIALLVIGLLFFFEEKQEKRWRVEDRLFFSLFSWGAMVALLRSFYAFVDVEAMLINYTLFVINFFMFFSLRNYPWTLPKIAIVILWYNLGLMANLIHIQLIGIVPGPNVEFVRAAGFFSNPNSLALACLFGILGCFFVFSVSQKRWMRLAAIIFFLADFYVLNKTSSRAGAVIAGLLLVIIIVWYYYTRRSAVGRFVMVATVVGLYFLSGSFSIGALERQRSREDRKVKEERDALTQAGLDAFEDTHFIGLGLAQFKEINNFYKYVFPHSAGIANERRQKNEGLVTHNSYTQVVAEIGAAGILLLATFWYTLIIRSLKNRHLSNDYFFFQAGVICIGVVYGLGHVIFLAPTLWFNLALIFPTGLYRK